MSFEQNQKLGFQNSREILLTPHTTLSQLMDQKSLTQSAAPSTSSVSIQDYWSDHLQPRQEFQVPHVFQDTRARSSSSLEVSGNPVSWKEKTKSKSTLALMNQGAPEVDLGNTMTFFSHWINPEVKGQSHEEPILHSKSLDSSQIQGKRG